MNALHLAQRTLRPLSAALAAVGLSGCYTVNSFVDAPDANPGDGICARAPTLAESRAGLLPLRRSAEEQRLQAKALEALGPDGLKRLAQGDPGLVKDPVLKPLLDEALPLLRKREALSPKAPGRVGDLAPRAIGLCTLRAAIEEANATPVKSVTTVPAGTYRLTLPLAQGGGKLRVTRSMRIQGADAQTTIVDAAGVDNVFLVDNNANDVEINHLTMMGASGSAGGGARIYRGRVEMEDVIVRDNDAFSAGGGLLVDAGSRLTLRRSTVNANYAAFGGGIRNDGELWVYDSTIHGNQGNRAGGVLNNGQMNLRNTTVSGNHADSPVAGVGGIYQGSFAVLNNVTVTNNEGRGVQGSWQGGGIQIANGATTVVKNSIIAGNNGNNSPHDCAGTLSFDSKHNLIGDSNGCTIPGFAFTYLLDVPAQLGVLADNGGPVLTHLPASGSPARNAAYGFPPPAADACEARDARGVPRPQGSGACDMGALEYTATSGEVTGFMLVDAATDTDIRPLKNDDWLILSDLPPQLAVRAITTGMVESVVFGFGGNASFRTENVAPYALGGDANGDYAAVAVPGGAQTLTATPFAADGGAGAAGMSRTIRLNVLQ